MTGVSDFTIPHFFKFMKAEHLETTLLRGMFRIGTLHEYRDVERLGDEIGDKEEGKKTTHLTATEPMAFDLLSDDPRAIHARKVLKGWDDFPSGSTIRIQIETGGSLQHYEDTYNCNMYCLALEFDVDQMRSFGYDSCLKITNPQGFLAELSNCVPSDQMLGAPVQYRDRIINYTDTTAASAAFIKPLKHAPQKEFRAIWLPKSSPVEPLLIMCPRALLYCEPYR